ncbi:MAG: archaemetzincin, partial [Verrucomicrobia bacterium]|nr:archaemetzincin [Verrucomicrobiota bacterium]
GWVLAGFVVPSLHDRAGAVGSLEGLSEPMRRAFTEGWDFEAKKTLAPGDWLASHEEAGQSFGQYLESGANKPKGLRTKLYVLPLGGFEEGAGPSLKLLRDYMRAYYHPLEVEMLPAVPTAEVPATSRINQFSRKTQWKSADVLRWLPRKLPGDAYAMIAVTMKDLYPEESWNFVFGQASIRDRVGVFSFARYHPGWVGGEAGPETEVLVLRRAAKVLTHEMGHMFGIRHCTFYECNMNGANHLAESDATPMHLCPVCLRKMQHAVGFDPRTRYAKLEGFYRGNGMEKEAGWVNDRRKWIADGE